MPTINISLRPGGPLFIVQLGVSIPRLEALQAGGVDIPAPVTGTFLLDTGASSTCVDPELIEHAGLPQIGVVGISTPSTNGGAHHCNQYDASMFIPGDKPGMGFVIPAIPIITTHLRSQGIDGLIGRDVINQCTLVYNGSAGMVSLSY